MEKHVLESQDSTDRLSLERDFRCLDAAAMGALEGTALGAIVQDLKHKQAAGPGRHAAYVKHSSHSSYNKYSSYSMGPIR